MTSNQFRAALKRLGLSQRGFAKLVGHDERTTRKWALDEAAVPPGIAILLRLMLAGKVTVEDVRNI
jgi:transcriptional regulator with XRE-family HTH domain